MFTSILSALAAIPALLKAVQELLAWFKKAEDEKWFTQEQKVFDSIKPGTTSDEKSQQAKDIQDAIKGL